VGLFTSRNSREDAAYLFAMKRDLALQIANPSSVQFLTDIVAGVEVRRVLDVGCGVGQALLPLAVSKGAVGVGVDVSEMACRMGRESFADHLPRAQTDFVRSVAESLPFATATFDVVNCALALPYTKNRQALRAMSRVLRNGGVLIIRLHHALFYIAMFWRGLKSMDLHPMVHAARVLVAGTIYHATGHQCQIRWLKETFQTRWMLRRELEQAGLCIERELPCSHPQSPYFAISKSR